MRALPDDNLAYPILISPSTGGAGSGFYLNGAKGVYLVTARHVLFSDAGISLRAPEITAVSYPKDPSETGENRFRIALTTLQNNGNLQSHPERDVALARIGIPKPEEGTFDLAPGVTAIKQAASGILGVSPTSIKTFDKVLVANEVFIFGYPTSLGLKNIPQLDYARPLLRKGIIAGKNDQLHTIILDCPVYPGNSGGPIVEVEQEGLTLHFAIVGVVSEFVPVAEEWLNKTHGYTNLEIGNSGYSVATPMDYVTEVELSFD